MLASLRKLENEENALEENKSFHNGGHLLQTITTFLLLLFFKLIIFFNCKKLGSTPLVFSVVSVEFEPVSLLVSLLYKLPT